MVLEFKDLWGFLIAIHVFLIDFVEHGGKGIGKRTIIEGYEFIPVELFVRECLQGKLLVELDDLLIQYGLELEDICDIEESEDEMDEWLWIE